MKGRDVVNWLALHKDYAVPIGTFLLGLILGALWL